MDSQITRPHGHSYEQETYKAGLHAENEDHEHHHEKKSVLEKVKAKAKKIKETIVHGHGHNHDREEDHLHHVPDDHDLYQEDDDDDEREEMPHEPRIQRTAAMASGKTNNIQEVRHAALNTPGIVKKTPQVTNQIGTSAGERERIRGQPEVNKEMLAEMEEDPQEPKDRPEHYSSSNYQTKVTDPTASGGEGIGITPILQSFDKMKIFSGSKPREEETPITRSPDRTIFPTGSHDQFSPEPVPPIPLISDSSSHSSLDTVGASKQGNYAEKTCSATSAIAAEEQKHTNPTSSPVEYGKKIAATVTKKIAPMYEITAETSSAMMSKVPGILGSTGNDGVEATNVKNQQDKGVSIKDYFADKLRPGDEDRALSEVITEALHKQRQETEKPYKPTGKVTESEKVRSRLGSFEENSEETVDQSSVHIPGGKIARGVVETLFGKAEETRGSQQQRTGEETGEKRLQESGN